VLQRNPGSGFLGITVRTIGQQIQAAHTALYLHQMDINPDSIVVRIRVGRGFYRGKITPSEALLQVFHPPVVTNQSRFYVPAAPKMTTGLVPAQEVDPDHRIIVDLGFDGLIADQYGIRCLPSADWLATLRDAREQAQASNATRIQHA
jgi:hypothetical protein